MTAIATVITLNPSCKLIECASVLARLNDQVTEGCNDQGKSMLNALDTAAHAISAVEVVAAKSHEDNRSRFHGPAL